MALNKARFFETLVSALALAGFFTSAIGSFALAAGPPDLQRACEVISAKIASLPISGKTIAVRPFLSIERQKTLLGARLQDGVTAALSIAKKRSYQLVERSRLFDLDTERALYGGDEDLDKWAAGLKADLLVLGTYSIDGSALMLEFRVVEPSGKVAGSGRASAPADTTIRKWAASPPPATPMLAAIEAVGQSGLSTARPAASKLSLFLMEKGIPRGFSVGEPIRIRAGGKIGFSIRPPMDSRLYVMNYDPQSHDESVVFLYPLPQFTPKIFRRDETYMFPGCIDLRALSYPVEPPLGRMVFKVIGVDASLEGANLIKDIADHSGYYQMGLEDIKGLLRDLAILPASAWWEEMVEFWVE